MNPELILQTDVLDIIFEHRNKEYGAYELRTRYKRRLKKSMSMMLLAVLLLSTVVYLDSRCFHSRSNRQLPLSYLDSVVLVNMPSPDKLLVIRPKPAGNPVRNIASVQFTKPLIIASDQPINPPPTMEDIARSLIATETKSGESPGDIAFLPVAGKDKGGATAAEPDPAVIFETVEDMPEFPGGEAGLKRFLSRSMHMPAVDMEPGTKIRVLEKF